MQQVMISALLLPLIVHQTEDFSKTWDQVANSIRTRFYAREARKGEMEGLLSRYGPQAKASHNRGEFEEVVNKMIHDFRDSHFDFLTKSDQGYYLMAGLISPTAGEPMPDFGAWFDHRVDGFTVRMVLDGGEAQRVGIRKGDVVQTVDGQPFSPVDSLKPRVGSEVVLQILRNHQVLSFKVKVQQEPCMEMFLNATKASSRIIDDNGRKIGYFHLWTQGNDSFKNALSSAVYGKLRDTDGFILDLRDGFGGRPEGYGDPFFRPEFWVDWNSGPKSGYRQLFGYQRPLVVLINSGSRSAKEMLSYAFKASHRATLVGRTTAGNVLGTYPQRINDWAFIEIPVVDVIVQGIRLENRGVAPDILVPAESDEGGNDLDLRTALGRLRNVRTAHKDPAQQISRTAL